MPHSPKLNATAARPATSAANHSLTHNCPYPASAPIVSK
jgi:hypothetical protein